MAYMCIGAARPTEKTTFYVGHRIGWLGVQNDIHVKVPLDELTEMANRVQVQLKEAGFRESPALHLQLEAQY
jgi:hypothetical protein